MTVTQENPTIADESDDEPTLQPARVSRRTTTLAVAFTIAMVAIVAVLGWKWHAASNDLNAITAEQADRAAAAQLANDYVLRSLTYDYKNLDGFFAGVSQDASNTLQDRYTQVRDTLSAIMTEAQVVASGSIAATAVDSSGTDRYIVTVFATQKTQNVQQPEPASVPNLLSVTVAHIDGTWLVDDYGPKES
ncbi:hypothetical protein [Antrihabitans spumae]|uniref:Mce-associated membrane protein n=1 Tax=Antrihabitans spumae TaxID=3373370 RepID=A0ABW7KLH4_9NOCA